MSAKSIPAAERKQIKAEIRVLETARKGEARFFAAERKKLLNQIEAARKQLTAFDKRQGKKTDSHIARIDRRIAVLKGRLGL